MRIAVDVMGGDHGCGVVIEGAIRALQADARIAALFLVGNKSEIHAALPRGGFRDHRVRVVHASEVLTMEDKSAAAVRRKKDCSLVRAIELVHNGTADAVVPRTADGVQPLCAAYARRLRVRVRRRIESGHLKVQDLLAAVRARELGPEDIARLDPTGLSFFNVNTPGDLGLAIRLAARAERHTRR